MCPVELQVTVGCRAGARHPGDPEHVGDVHFQKMFPQGLRRDPEFRTVPSSYCH